MNIFLILHNALNKLNTFVTIYKYKLQYSKKLQICGKLYLRKGFVLIAEGRLKIGNGCFFNNNCSVNSLESVEIGDNCIFGENVHIYDHNHNYIGNSLISEAGFKTSPVRIGNNVWVSSNAVILKGVTIGDNSVIGAGVIVYKDVPSNSLLINNQNIVIK